MIFLGPRTPGSAEFGQIFHHLPILLSAFLLLKNWGFEAFLGFRQLGDFILELHNEFGLFVCELVSKP